MNARAWATSEQVNLFIGDLRTSSASADAAGRMSSERDLWARHHDSPATMGAPTIGSDFRKGRDHG